MESIVMGVITLCLSIGGAVFASGRMIGKICTRIENDERDIAQNKKELVEMSKENRRRIEDASREVATSTTCIRREVSSIRESLAGLSGKIDTFTKLDTTIADIYSKLGEIGEKVAYMSGVMAKEEDKKK